MLEQRLRTGCRNFVPFPSLCDKYTNLRETRMVDKARIKGSAEQAKGKVKEWAGKAAGDTKTQAKGKAEQVKGKARNAVGGLRDAARGK